MDSHTYEFQILISIPNKVIALQTELLLRGCAYFQHDNYTVEGLRGLAGVEKHNENTLEFLNKEAVWSVGIQNGDPRGSKKF
jgi:hypothetical protein